MIVAHLIHFLFSNFHCSPFAKPWYCYYDLESHCIELVPGVMR